MPLLFDSSLFIILTLVDRVLNLYLFNSLDCESLRVKVWCVFCSLIFGSAAARTKNFSGAELEGVVKSAVSFALNRQLSLDDLTKPVDEESIKVTMDDFLHALHEIIPAFGASTDDLERCR